jgi:predicted  nucleic acid-binding Zn-ribbon protein
MAERVAAGSNVSAGTYRCTDCGSEIDVGSTRRLPPCPVCGNGSYEPAPPERRHERRPSDGSIELGGDGYQIEAPTPRD